MWEEHQNILSKTYMFAHFADAMAFIVKVWLLAEKSDHHPTIINTYTTVRIELSTHDAGNIVTDLDREMARTIDSFF